MLTSWTAARWARGSIGRNEVTLAGRGVSRPGEENSITMSLRATTPGKFLTRRVTDADCVVVA
jgi:hypothetical protein